MYIIGGSTRFLIACLEKFGVESTLSITEYLHFYMQWEKHYALNLPHPLPTLQQHPHSIEHLATLAPHMIPVSATVI